MEYLSLDHGGEDVGLVEAELQRVSKKSVAIYYYELSFLATLFSQANLMVGSERFLRRTTLKVKVNGHQTMFIVFPSI